MAKSVRFANRKRSSLKKRRAQIGKKSKVARVRRSRRRVKVMRGGADPKNILLIIDPQIDFHPQGGEMGTPMYHPPGSLAVQGANEDSERITALITNYIDKWDQIIVSMDTHNPNHIAHGAFWEDENGVSPPPFTLITTEDIVSGKWLPRNKTLREHCIFYTTKLAENGRFQLIIWPEHCIQGSIGHAVVPNIEAALREWCKKTGKNVDFILKGQNNLTEMYSVIAADVPMVDDPATQKNDDLLNAILNTNYGFSPNSSTMNNVYICGQALSHCVAFTTRDIVKEIITNTNYGEKLLPNLRLLTDCSSPVGGFETQAKQFIDEVKGQGVQCIPSDKVAF